LNKNWWCLVLLKITFCISISIPSNPFLSLRVKTYLKCPPLSYNFNQTDNQWPKNFSYDARRGSWNLGARWSDGGQFGTRAYFQVSQLGCIFFDILLVYNCFALKSLSLLISKDFLAYLLNGCVKEYRFPNNATLKEHLTDQLLYLSNVISYILQII